MSTGNPTSNPHFIAALQDILGFRDAHARLLRSLDHFERSLPARLAESNAAPAREIQRLIAIARRFLYESLTTKSPEVAAHLLAAVDYFIDQDDASPDFATLDGFDDDKLLFEAVAWQFDLTFLLDEKSNAA